MPRKSGLGRGLSALIPDAPPPHALAADVTDEFRTGVTVGSGAPASEVPIELLVPNPQQPRSRFCPAPLAALLDSLRFGSLDSSRSCDPGTLSRTIHHQSLAPVQPVPNESVN